MMPAKMTREYRLGFLWLSSVAVRQARGEFSYTIQQITRDPIEELANSEGFQFSEEAREIGKQIAHDGGFKAMVAAMDEVEGLHGLNAGEWIARRWDGIETKEGRTWNA